jgi:hypothetical protein
LIHLTTTLHVTIWQTHEDGSDGTVRVSSGNLNYRMISLDQNVARPALSVKRLSYKMPHLVLSGVTQTGESGILGGNATTMQKVYPQIKDALNISNKQAYDALAAAWQAKTVAWNNENAEQCCSTIVFSLQQFVQNRTWRQSGGERTQPSPQAHVQAVGQEDHKDVRLYRSGRLPGGQFAEHR